MCMGGSDKATQAAQQQETDRQNKINANIASINGAFSNRAPEYANFKTALQQQYQTELNRQQAIAGRNNKFALARSGLTGGSAAVDAGRLLGQEEAQGTVTAQQAVN